MSAARLVVADEAPAGAFDKIFATAGIVATAPTVSATLAANEYPNISTALDAKLGVTREILRERFAQDAKWGEQNHPDGTGGEYDQAKADIARGVCDANTRKGTLTWRHVLAEEVYEAFAESEPRLLRAELLQVAAVATAWVEAIDRKAAAL